MEEGTARQLLLRLLRDETAAEHYHREILTCANARELFDRVILPLISARLVDEDSARKSSFYLTLARPMEERTGQPVNKSTLHGLIDRHYTTRKSKLSTEELMAHISRTLPEGECVSLTINPATGSMHLIRITQTTVVDKETALELMREGLRQHAEFSLRHEKHFNARQHIRRAGLQLTCEAPDVCALLRGWQAIGGCRALRFTCANALTEQEGLTLEEVIDMWNSANTDGHV
ncbi:MAG: hypothetical protein NC388_09845 [Clostridium sp.]|nr:hypothetical protein [Clostridium sp.]